MAASGTPSKAMGDSIYAYETSEGTRYYFKYRDPAGNQSTKRGFVTRTASRRERERLMGKVHRGEARVSRESLGGFWARYLAQRKPYLEHGSWQDYRRHGELRILPHLGHRKLTSLSAPELRAWLVELSESGDWAPKTLNNALKALVVCLNHAVADGCSATITGIWLVLAERLVNPAMLYGPDLSEHRDRFGDSGRWR